ncbi:LOW QUALITY PROTEIN: uncharacterized protein LOC117140619 [Drosophila mauritiana]|uniref:LOW QUALITY PROTEIN: uncharacterized protein LOC117140619 n=1 Tax=Drosophila mauritiana TaxID=7226 RepID=A0A6P8K579_DROMA|nr:LOW QUALITY PROTEIN: uncharacterized protein LOC117140619 [Drosophila mauritiana]
MDQLKLRPCNCLTAHSLTEWVWVECGRLCTLRLASFQKGLSEKGCPRTPMPIDEDSWSKRFRHFLFVSACILWPRHGHLPIPLTLPQWKIQFSQSLLIFSSLCGCLVCCTIRCCCCWPSRKSVKSQDLGGVADTKAEEHKNVLAVYPLFVGSAGNAELEQ